MPIQSKTKPKESPKKVKKEGVLEQVYAVQKPYSGCQLTSLVHPIDPLLGIGAGHELAPEKIHAVYSDPQMAQSVAEELYEAYCKQEQMLEEKKGKTSDQIKKAIDKLEKKRKEHVNLAKEDPKSAAQHKEHIAKIATQIDDLMSKMEKIEKSKKEIEKKEEKKDLKENLAISEAREYDKVEMEKLGFDLYPGGRNEAWEFATTELGVPVDEILGKMGDDDVYNAIYHSLDIMGYFNRDEEDQEELQENKKRK